MSDEDGNIYSGINKRVQYNPKSRIPGETQPELEDPSMEEFLGKTPHKKAENQPWDPEGVAYETQLADQRAKAIRKRIAGGVPKKRYVRGGQ